MQSLKLMISNDTLTWEISLVKMEQKIITLFSTEYFFKIVLNIKKYQT